MLSHLILRTINRNVFYCHFLFMDEEIRSWRDEVISQGASILWPGELSGSRAQVVTRGSPLLGPLLPHPPDFSTAPGTAGHATWPLSPIASVFLPHLASSVPSSKHSTQIYAPSQPPSLPCGLFWLSALGTSLLKGVRRGNLPEKNYEWSRLEKPQGMAATPAADTWNYSPVGREAPGSCPQEEELQSVLTRLRLT